MGTRAVRRFIESRPVQTKLKIGQPRDAYEQEADRAAEQVMRMPSAQTWSTALYIRRKPLVRATAEGELPEREGSESHIPLGACRELAPSKQESTTYEPSLVCKLLILGCRLLIPDRLLARETRRTEVSAAGQTEINGMQGGARPLPQSARDFFEPRFGHDFGAVKVHDDARAAGAARTLTARAFTIGDHVVFGSGEFSPQTGDGRRLLAHELAHVVQQRNGSSETPPIQIQRTLNNEPTRLHTGRISTTLREGNEESALDREIDRLLAKPSASETGNVLMAIDYLPAGDISAPERIALKASLLSVIGSQKEDEYTDAEYRLRVPMQSEFGLLSEHKFAFIIVRFDSTRKAEVTLSSTENKIGRNISASVGENCGGGQAR